MRRPPLAVPSAGFASLAVFLSGCGFLQFGGPKPKDVSPASAAGLRPERMCRKKPNAPATPEQAAVFTFLDEDKARFAEATAGVGRKSPPSAVTAALAGYAEKLSAADAGPLPAEFQTELARYRDAYRDLPRVLARLPDGSFEGAAFYDALAALFRGDADKGKPLGGDAAEAVKTAKAAAAKLYETAAQYAVEADR